MKLKRSDVEVGDLLTGICNVSLATDNFIHDDCLYVA